MSLDTASAEHQFVFASCANSHGPARRRRNSGRQRGLERPALSSAPARLPKPLRPASSLDPTPPLTGAEIDQMPSAAKTFLALMLPAVAALATATTASATRKMEIALQDDSVF